jgi:hypothetical protein
VFLAHDIFDLVLEEKWYFCGEAAEAPLDLTKEALWKTLKRITILPTNKDAAALLRIALMNPPDSDFRELTLVKKLTSKPIDEAVAYIKKALEKHKRPISDYEAMAVNRLYATAAASGLITTRTLCLIVIALIMGRGLPKKEIKARIKSTPKKKKGVLEKLPWWAFTAETEVGQKAIEMFLEKYGSSPSMKGIDTKVFGNLHYIHETEACLDAFKVHTIPEGGRATWEQMVWWGRYAELVGKAPGKSFQETQILWIDKISPRLMKIIQIITG